MRFQKITSVAVAASVASAQSNGTLPASNATNSTSFPLQNQQLNTFWTVLQTYGLLNQVNSASNITLLAPNNDALAALNSSGVSLTEGYVRALLNYHTLNGTYASTSISNVTEAFPHTYLTNSSYSNVTGGQVVEVIRSNTTVSIFSGLKNNVSVTQADLNFTGGILHIVDGLLTIPGNLTETAINANLTSFVGAAQELNLTSTLGNLRDVTIFAPENTAFQAVGDALANASTSELISILGYHVVNNSVLYSADLMNTTVQTFGGSNLTIQNLNGSYYVNSAEVINPDILFSGGVIHVIDRVLNPNNTVAHNATETSSGSKSSTSQAFSGVTTQASNVPFTSGIATPTTSNGAQGSATTGAAASSTGAAAPLKTGAVGAAALFGGIAAVALGF